MQEDIIMKRRIKTIMQAMCLSAILLCPVFSCQADEWAEEIDGLFVSAANETAAVQAAEDVESVEGETEGSGEEPVFGEEDSLILEEVMEEETSVSGTDEEKALDDLLLSYDEMDSTDPLFETEEGEEDACIASGICGLSAVWAFYADRYLVISGEGQMMDYTLEDGTPWEKYALDIREVQIDEGITHIGRYAFNALQSLETVRIPGTVETIAAGAFRDCPNLNHFVVDDANRSFRITDGILYSSDGRDLICYPQSLSDPVFTIPETVETIHEYAFYGQDYLQKICLTSLQIEIGDNAFAGCTALNDITMAEAEE